MKRQIIEEAYIKIVASGEFYDSHSSSRSDDIIYLDERFDENKDYSLELEKANKQFAKERHWNNAPEIIRYWKTVSINTLEE